MSPLRLNRRRRNPFIATLRGETLHGQAAQRLASPQRTKGLRYQPPHIIRRAVCGQQSGQAGQFTDSQMRAWENLAGHLKGASLFGEAVTMTGHNAFVRLNSNRVMAGEPILRDAPSYHGTIPNVVYDEAVVTPEFIAINGIKHAPSPYKLVVRRCPAPRVSASPTAGARQLSFLPVWRMTGVRQT